jgi:hypothetical protein
MENHLPEHPVVSFAFRGVSADFHEINPGGEHRSKRALAAVALKVS